MLETKNNIREVWSSNRSEEMTLIQKCLRDHRFVAIDSEFPGCLRQTPMNVTNDERYHDMSYNINNTKLIQLGLTFFSRDGKIGGSWEVNFSDFGHIGDARNKKSIEFLKHNGVDLEKIRQHGIDIKDFFSDLSCILRKTKNVTWVTFHGSYDVVYLLKYFTRKGLPLTSKIFSQQVARVFGSIYDIKVMAGRCQGLGSLVGLESLAREMGLNRIGTAHHAGSDSEITARVFIKMVEIFHDVEESEGLVYGLGYRICSSCLEHDVEMMQRTGTHMHDHRMMTRCYGPPPPLFMAPMPQLRPVFISGFPPFLVPSIPMY